MAQSRAHQRSVSMTERVMFAPPHGEWFAFGFGRRGRGVARGAAVALSLVTAAALLASDQSVLSAQSVVAEGAASAVTASAAALPVAVDLSPKFERWSLTRLRQGGRPTCSAFTVTGALEYAIAEGKGSCPRLSVEFLNWAANQVAGDSQDGGFFSDLWRGFELHGIAAEADWPYQASFDPARLPPPQAAAAAKTRLDLPLRIHWIKPWDVNTGLTEAQLTDLRRTLHAGWPVCGGFRWPKQEQWVAEVLQMCGPDAVRDGHSVLLVGYRADPQQPGGGVFKFRNTSGDGRDGYMPYAYARAFMNDAVWIGFADAR